MKDRNKLGMVPSPAMLLEHMQKMAYDWHNLKGKRDVQDRTSDGFTQTKIVANKGPTLEFDGRLLIEYSTDPQHKKTRWTELRLWETPKGAWIVESVGCSDDAGQVDIVDAQVFCEPMAVYEVQTMIDFDASKGPVQQQPREIQVMDWLGWSYPARAIAKKLGWNLTVKVD